MATIDSILAGDNANQGRVKINTNFTNVNNDLATHDINLGQLNTRIDDVELVIDSLDFVSEFGGAITGDLTVSGQTQTGTLVSTGTSNLQGAVTLGSAGTGTTNAVRADRQIIAGNGLTGGGNFTSDKTITLGTPGTLTTATSNSVSSTSHTHAITFPVSAAGNGVTLSSGTIALGTPGTLTTATTNSVTASSHTHAITASDNFLPSLTAGTSVAGVTTRLSMEFSNSAGGGADVVRRVHFVANRTGTIRVYAQHRRTGNATGNHTLTFYKGKSSIGTWTMNSTTLTTRSVDTTVVNGTLITIELVQDVPSSGTYGVEAINCSLRAAQSSLRVPAYYASPSDDPTEITL